MKRIHGSYIPPGFPPGYNTYAAYHSWSQPYRTVYGHPINYIYISIDGHESNNRYSGQWLINSSFSGITISVDYEHIGAHVEYFRYDELGFTITFQISLVFIVKGFGKVYSYPPESHFCRYDFRTDQGAMYQ